MDNSIRLKELQVVREALKKGDEGLAFFWGWKGEDGVNSPLSKASFF